MKKENKIISENSYIPFLYSLLAFGLGLIVSFILWHEIQLNHKYAIQMEFNQRAQLIKTEIQKELDFEMDGLVALRAFFNASDFVTEDEFHIFTRELLKIHRRIQALAWAPLIAGANRVSFEAKISSSGYPSFQILERNINDQMIPAEKRDFYFPIIYFEPYLSNKKILGFDLNSEPVRKEALGLSRDTGLFVVTPQISLIQGSLGVLGVAPIYKKGESGQTNFSRKQALMGFVIGVYRIAAIIEQAFANLEDKDKNISVLVSDISIPNSQPTVLFRQIADSDEVKAKGEGIEHYKGFLHVPGKLWQIEVFPATKYIQLYQNRLPLKTFLTFLAFSEIFAVVVYLFLLARARAQSVLSLNQSLTRLNDELENKVLLRTNELNAANAELLAANEDLNQSNQELEQFSYVASHDLQEPLRKITSFITILENDLQDRLDNDSRENMAFIVDAAARMSHLIKDLLELSRLGRTKLVLQRLDLNDVVKDVIAILDESIRNKKAEISYDQLPILNQVSPLIAQVFQNLIGNAIKFCTKDKTPYVHISAKEEQDRWVFCVKDNGIGIEKKYLDTIFEVFRRLHQRGEYPGTGIGLAICKKIVERHGGKIWAESNPVQGTSFFFTLPSHFVKKKDSLMTKGM